jgi:hypothetical protein
MKRAQFLMIIFGLCLMQDSFASDNARIGVYWDLSRDVGATNNQISFSQGSNNVWHFLRAPASALHQPTVYQFIDRYSLSNETGCFAGNNVGCYRTVGEGPGVMFNFQSTPNSGATIILPGRTLALQPGNNGALSIIGWKCPLSIHVRIQGSFEIVETCFVDGVRWYVDKNSQNLVSGKIPALGLGPRPFHINSIVVRKDEVLYFIVDNGGGSGSGTCDTTALRLTISGWPARSVGE